MNRTERGGPPVLAPYRPEGFGSKLVIRLCRATSDPIRPVEPGCGRYPALRKTASRIECLGLLSSVPGAHIIARDATVCHPIR
jgi:hypothetical protein